MAEDHYDVLEVSRKASPDMVRKAYRIQLATHHPDRGGDAVRAQMINEAFCVLGDPVKRRAYDDELTERETKRAARARPADAAEEPEPKVAPNTEPGWGEEVRVEEPLVPESAAEPARPNRAPATTGDPFPWETGGMQPPTSSAAPVAPAKRPLIRGASGSILTIISLLPLVMLFFDASWESAISLVGCGGVALLLAWLAGRRRAAGGVLRFEYVIYLLVLVSWLIANVSLMLRATSGAPVSAWLVLGYQCVWAGTYVLYVESSCIHNRRVYWSRPR